MKVVVAGLYPDNIRKEVIRDLSRAAGQAPDLVRFRLLRDINRAVWYTAQNSG